MSNQSSSSQAGCWTLCHSVQLLLLCVKIPGLLRMWPWSRRGTRGKTGHGMEGQAGLRGLWLRSILCLAAVGCMWSPPSEVPTAHQ